MKTKSRIGTFVILGFACIAGGIFAFYTQQPVAYYTLYSLAIALLIAALVELRLDTLDRNLTNYSICTEKAMKANNLT